MRDFNEADRDKKSARIRIPENPGNLTGETLAELESSVKASLKDGYLSCPTAWGIAKKYSVPKVVIGEIADRTGVRITDCQLGCFKIDKTPFDASGHENISGEVINMLESLNEKGDLDCARVFEMAGQYRLKPLTIANEMSARGIKIRGCQMGCF